MGTNYYLQRKNCPKQHIGKASRGWCFMLCVYPQKGIHDLTDWIYEFTAPHSCIVNEFGTSVSPLEMTRVITERSSREPISKMFNGCQYAIDNFLKRNNAILGPNNLLRVKLGTFCIKHGEGTWDCVIGGFA